MYFFEKSPIEEVTLGEALKTSLDNYYDLLKEQVGGLQSEEYLQLKLVADTVDISDKRAGEGGYKWFSYYNLLKRSDKAIVPVPVLDNVQTSSAEFTEVYEKFLRKLRQFVVKKELTPDDQLKLADLDKTSDSIKLRMRELAKLDLQDWREEAESMGFQKGDMAAYVQWSNIYGHIRDIEQGMRELQDVEFDKKKILDKKYPDPDDRAIIDAEFNFYNPTMRLRYPVSPDTDYPLGDSFNITYLALLPLGSTALFDDRRAISWDKTLTVIKTATIGSFSATLDKETQESKSITSDWSASGNVSYGFLRVKASGSEHKKITEDFKKSTKIILSAKAVYKVGIEFLGWFNATLFEHKHVKENIDDFREFFSPSGTLLYYPSHLIMLRGFKVEFESSQDWKYDYEKQFSASGGGGFNVCGINFGASSSYSSHVKEHKIAKSSTKLSISDDEATIRFVGYAVKKNNHLLGRLRENLKNAHSKVKIEEYNE